ncbi:MAG: hypothetical protein IT223_00325 [Crocinitomicaceae bacterium]|nr:hypothetical protein [Crocinitomicaceae bacterium]
MFLELQQRQTLSFCRKCYALLLPFFFLLLSCNDGKDKTTGAAEEILKSSGRGDFRGVKMGDHIDNVRQKEGSGFVYSMPDELVYRIPASGLDSIWYEISYNFNEQGLYNINLEVYGKNHDVLEEITKSFSEYYGRRYGAPSVSFASLKWRTMTDNGRYVNITLKDSLKVIGQPCIQVNFNESEN